MEWDWTHEWSPPQWPQQLGDLLKARGGVPETAQLDAAARLYMPEYRVPVGVTRSSGERVHAPRDGLLCGCAVGADGRLVALVVADHVHMRELYTPGPAPTTAFAYRIALVPPPPVLCASSRLLGDLSVHDANGAVIGGPSAKNLVIRAAYAASMTRGDYAAALKARAPTGSLRAVRDVEAVSAQLPSGASDWSWAVHCIVAASARPAGKLRLAEPDARRAAYARVAAAYRAQAAAGVPVYVFGVRAPSPQVPDVDWATATAAYAEINTADTDASARLVRAIREQFADALGEFDRGDDPTAPVRPEGFEDPLTRVYRSPLYDSVSVTVADVGLEQWRITATTPLLTSDVSGDSDALVQEELGNLLLEVVADAEIVGSYAIYAPDACPGRTLPPATDTTVGAPAPCTHEDVDAGRVRVWEATAILGAALNVQEYANIDAADAVNAALSGLDIDTTYGTHAGVLCLRGEKRAAALRAITTALVRSSRRSTQRLLVTNYAAATRSAMLAAAENIGEPKARKAAYAQRWPRGTFTDGMLLVACAMTPEAARDACLYTAHGVTAVCVRSESLNPLCQQTVLPPLLAAPTYGAFADALDGVLRYGTDPALPVQLLLDPLRVEQRADVWQLCEEARSRGFELCKHPGYWSEFGREWAYLWELPAASNAPRPAASAVVATRTTRDEARELGSELCGHPGYWSVFGREWVSLWDPPTAPDAPLPVTDAIKFSCGRNMALVYIDAYPSGPSTRGVMCVLFDTTDTEADTRDRLHVVARVLGYAARHLLPCCFVRSKRGAPATRHVETPLLRGARHAAQPFSEAVAKTGGSDWRFEGRIGRFDEFAEWHDAVGRGWRMEFDRPAATPEKWTGEARTHAGHSAARYRAHGWYRDAVNAASGPDARTGPDGAVYGDDRHESVPHLRGVWLVIAAKSGAGNDARELAAAAGVSLVPTAYALGPDAEITQHNAPVLFLSFIFTAPAFRRQGLAKCILDALHTIAAYAGASRIALEAVPNSLADEMYREKFNYRKPHMPSAMMGKSKAAIKFRARVQQAREEIQEADAGEYDESVDYRCLVRDVDLPDEWAPITEYTDALSVCASLDAMPPRAAAAATAAAVPPWEFAEPARVTTVGDTVYAGADGTQASHLVKCVWSPVSTAAGAGVHIRVQPASLDKQPPPGDLEKAAQTAVARLLNDPAHHDAKVRLLGASSPAMRALAIYVPQQAQPFATRDEIKEKGLPTQAPATAVIQAVHSIDPVFAQDPDAGCLAWPQLLRAERQQDSAELVGSGALQAQTLVWNISAALSAQDSSGQDVVGAGTSAASACRALLDVPIHAYKLYAQAVTSLDIVICIAAMSGAGQRYYIVCAPLVSAAARASAAHDIDVSAIPIVAAGPATWAPSSRQLVSALTAARTVPAIPDGMDEPGPSRRLRERDTAQIAAAFMAMGKYIKETTNPPEVYCADEAASQNSLHHDVRCVYSTRTAPLLPDNDQQCVVYDATAMHAATRLHAAYGGDFWLWRMGDAGADAICHMVLISDGVGFAVVHHKRPIGNRNDAFVAYIVPFALAPGRPTPSRIGDAFGALFKLFVEKPAGSFALVVAQQLLLYDAGLVEVGPVQPANWTRVSGQLMLDGRRLADVWCMYSGQAVALTDLSPVPPPTQTAASGVAAAADEALAVLRPGHGPADPMDVSSDNGDDYGGGGDGGGGDDDNDSDSDSSDDGSGDDDSPVHSLPSAPSPSPKRISTQPAVRLPSAQPAAPSSSTAHTVLRGTRIMLSDDPPDGPVLPAFAATPPALAEALTARAMDVSGNDSELARLVKPTEQAWLDFTYYNAPALWRAAALTSGMVAAEGSARSIWTPPVQTIEETHVRTRKGRLGTELYTAEPLQREVPLALTYTGVVMLPETREAANRADPGTHMTIDGLLTGDHYDLHATITGSSGRPIVVQVTADSADKRCPAAYSNMSHAQGAKLLPCSVVTAPPGGFPCQPSNTDTAVACVTLETGRIKVATNHPAGAAIEWDYEWRRELHALDDGSVCRCNACAQSTKPKPLYLPPKESPIKCVIDDMCAVKLWPGAEKFLADVPATRDVRTNDITDALAAGLTRRSGVLSDASDLDQPCALWHRSLPLNLSDDTDLLLLVWQCAPSRYGSNGTAVIGGQEAVGAMQVLFVRCQEDGTKHLWMSANAHAGALCMNAAKPIARAASYEQLVPTIVAAVTRAMSTHVSATWTSCMRYFVCDHGRLRDPAASKTASAAVFEQAAAAPLAAAAAPRPSATAAPSADAAAAAAKRGDGTAATAAAAAASTQAAGTPQRRRRVQPAQLAASSPAMTPAAPSSIAVAAASGEELVAYTQDATVRTKQLRLAIAGILATRTRRDAQRVFEDAHGHREFRPLPPAPVGVTGALQRETIALYDSAKRARDDFELAQQYARTAVDLVGQVEAAQKHVELVQSIEKLRDRARSDALVANREAIIAAADATDKLFRAADNLDVFNHMRGTEWQTVAGTLLDSLEATHRVGSGLATEARAIRAPASAAAQPQPSPPASPVAPASDGGRKRSSPSTASMSVASDASDVALGIPRRSASKRVSASPELAITPASRAIAVAALGDLLAMFAGIAREYQASWASGITDAIKANASSAASTSSAASASRRTVKPPDLPQAGDVPGALRTIDGLWGAWNGLWRSCVHGTPPDETDGDSVVAHVARLNGFEWLTRGTWSVVSGKLARDRARYDAPATRERRETLLRVAVVQGRAGLRYVFADNADGLDADTSAAVITLRVGQFDGDAALAAVDARLADCYTGTMVDRADGNCSASAVAAHRMAVWSETEIAGNDADIAGVTVRGAPGLPTTERDAPAVAPIVEQYAVGARVVTTPWMPRGVLSAMAGQRSKCVVGVEFPHRQYPSATGMDRFAGFVSVPVPPAGSVGMSTVVECAVVVSSACTGVRVTQLASPATAPDTLADASVVAAGKYRPAVLLVRYDGLIDGTIRVEPVGRDARALLLFGAGEQTTDDNVHTFCGAWPVGSAQAPDDIDSINGAWAAVVLANPNPGIQEKARAAFKRKGNLLAAACERADKDAQNAVDGCILEVKTAEQSLAKVQKRWSELNQRAIDARVADFNTRARAVDGRCKVLGNYAQECRDIVSGVTAAETRLRAIGDADAAAWKEVATKAADWRRVCADYSAAINDPDFGKLQSIPRCAAAVLQVRTARDDAVAALDRLDELYTSVQPVRTYISQQAADVAVYDSIAAKIVGQIETVLDPGQAVGADNVAYGVPRPQQRPTRSVPADSPLHTEMVRIEKAVADAATRFESLRKEKLGARALRREHDTVKRQVEALERLDTAAAAAAKGDWDDVEQQADVAARAVLQANTAAAGIVAFERGAGMRRAIQTLVQRASDLAGRIKTAIAAKRRGEEAEVRGTTPESDSDVFFGARGARGGPVGDTAGDLRARLARHAASRF